MNAPTGCSSTSTSTSNTASETASSSTDASIEGEGALDPALPGQRHAWIKTHDDFNEADEHELLATPTASMVGSTATLRPWSLSSSASSTPDLRNSATRRMNEYDDSLRIPRELPAPYGDDNADGDDDGNMEDIEDGDEYDDDDDEYGYDDHLFERPSTRQAAAMASATALFAAEGVFDLHDYDIEIITNDAGLVVTKNVLVDVNKSSNNNRTTEEEDMDDVEKSFINPNKPICSKKQLVSCLSSRSVSPGPISPLLSDEDFPSLCSSSSTACSSRRSSDGGAAGAHTPRVRFKKGCVITAVNLTWAPTTYDRAPIDVAESLDIKRCQTMQDAEAEAERSAHCITSTGMDRDVTMLGQDEDDNAKEGDTIQPKVDDAGQWQAFAPDIYTSEISTKTNVQLGEIPLTYRPPSPPAASSPCTAAHANYAYASTFGTTRSTSSGLMFSQYEEDTSRRSASTDSSASDAYLSVPEMTPSSLPTQTSYRNSVGYPFARVAHAFETSSASSSCSSSESEADDLIERFRRPSRERQCTTIYRPSVRSALKNTSTVSANATADTSLGVAARELSDSFDESSRSSSPAPCFSFNDCSEDYLSSTPRATYGAGPLAGEAFSSRKLSTSASSMIATPMSRQDSLEANGTHETSPPPQEDQPLRKMQRRSHLAERKLCALFGGDDVWDSCDALGGF